MTETPQAKPGLARLTLVATALLATLIGLWVALSQVQPGSGSSPQGLTATVLIPPREVAPFNLLDHHGERFDLARLREHWSFVFFGYTFCPDVCPTTLGIMDRAATLIEDAPATAAPAQFVFISVDPERDTVQRLAEFIPWFNPEFVGVTGELQDLTGLTRQIGILHARGAADQGGGYLVDHSASVLLLDPGGNIRALFSPPLNAEILAREFGILSNWYEESR